MVQVIVQRRVPTYDAVVRTVGLSTHAVKLRLEHFFAAARELPGGFVLFDRRFFGEFEGETAFVVRPSSGMYRGSARPVIDGYLLINEEGGTDILLRTAYPTWAWAVEASLLVVLAVVTAFSTGVSELLFMLPMAAFLGLFTLLVVVAEGARFTSRIRKLFAATVA